MRFSVARPVRPAEQQEILVGYFSCGLIFNHYEQAAQSRIPNWPFGRYFVSRRMRSKQGPERAFAIISEDSLFPGPAKPFDGLHQIGNQGPLAVAGRRPPAPMLRSTALALYGHLIPAADE